MLLLVLLLLATTCAAQCAAPFSSDPNIGSTPAIPPAEVAAAGPPSSPCVESSVVRNFVQPEAPASVPARSQCPHDPSQNLVPLALNGQAAGANIDVVGRRIVRACDVDSQILGRITVKSGSLLVFDDSDIRYPRLLEL